MLYESAYNIPFYWENHVPESIFKYHSLVWKETNSTSRFVYLSCTPICFSMPRTTYQRTFFDADLLY